MTFYCANAYTQNFGYFFIAQAVVDFLQHLQLSRGKRTDIMRIFAIHVENLSWGGMQSHGSLIFTHMILPRGTLGGADSKDPQWLANS